jgi:DNA-binding FadR family transcriptional regulator
LAIEWPFFLQRMQVENHSKGDMAHRSIEGRILNGVLGIGDQIPTESELATELICRRGTASKAIARLTHCGDDLRQIWLAEIA